jgi:hypothetical protein
MRLKFAHPLDYRPVHCGAALGKRIGDAFLRGVIRLPTEVLGDRYKLTHQRVTARNHNSPHCGADYFFSGPGAMPSIVVLVLVSAGALH